MGNKAGTSGTNQGTLPGAGHAPGGLHLPAVMASNDAVQDGAPSDVLPSGRAYWRELIARYSDWDVDTMLQIIEGPTPNCPNGESGGDENAVSPDRRNVGPYQINVGHGYSYEEMTDPQRSTEIAHDIWLSQGYGAWSCY